MPRAIKERYGESLFLTLLNNFLPVNTKAAKGLEYGLK